MKKETLINEMTDVIKTTKFEREQLIHKRATNTMTKADIEISKTVISANKNIVSAAVVIKGLLHLDGQED